MLNQKNLSMEMFDGNFTILVHANGPLRNPDSRVSSYLFPSQCLLVRRFVCATFPVEDSWSAAAKHNLSVNKTAVSTDILDQYTRILCKVHTLLVYDGAFTFSDIEGVCLLAQQKIEYNVAFNLDVFKGYLSYKLNTVNNS